MAAAVHRYNTARISRWRRSRALLEATGRRHRASIMSDNMNRTWLRRFFWCVFIVKIVGKGHRLTLRPLFSIGVLHIKRERRAQLRWVYNLLGGSVLRIIWWSGWRIAIVFVGTVSRAQLRTLKKTRKMYVFFSRTLSLGTIASIGSPISDYDIVVG